MTYTKDDSRWQRGRSWLGGTIRLADGSPNQKFIRALDIQTGRTVWSYAQTGKAETVFGRSLDRRRPGIFRGRQRCLRGP